MFTITTARISTCLLLLLPIVEPLCMPTAAQTKAEQIHTLLTEYHEFRLFNGSVLVAKNGQILYSGGFGEADMAWDIPNTTKTKFRIASTTKQFTASLILTLVEAGKMELDGKIVDYLPSYPAAQGERVTIHHLLSHTSGIPSYTSLPGFMSQDVRDPYDPDSLLTLFSGLELQFGPGEQWAYSNSGYILLGAIIEGVTGKSYEKVLRERILEPLDLDNTGYSHYHKVIKCHATGYVKTPGGYNRAPYLDTSVPYSAGMLYSTIEDLFKWDQLLYGVGPFDKMETKALLFTPRVSLPDGLSQEYGLPPSYGYGWFVGDVPIGGDTIKVIEHGGNIFGFSTGFLRMPDEKNTVIIMDNTSSTSVRQIGRGLISILYGKAPEKPKQPISDVLCEVIESEGIKAAKRLYRELSRDNPMSFDLRESELNDLGYYYLSEGRVEEAIEVLQLNVEAYPESANSYNSLAEAYMKVKNRSMAIENYLKVLELNPNSENAKEALKSLKVDLE